MGFSVISIIELFYFFSIRPYCNLIRISDRSTEVLSKIFRKMEIVHRKKGSSFIIKKVDSSNETPNKIAHTYLEWVEAEEDNLLHLMNKKKKQLAYGNFFKPN